MSAPDPAGTAGDPRLTDHLRAYLGAWPPSDGIEVVGFPGRLLPAWDGELLSAVVVHSPDGTVVSVAPDIIPAVAWVDGADPAADTFPAELAAAVGRPGRASPWIPMRWSATPAPLPDAGEWVESTHAALPEWLHAFPSPVLAVFAEDGTYLAGLGLKVHTRFGRELAVGTAEPARGRGLARRLVAQAGRAVLAGGAIPLYMHHPDNEASARVADAAGFPDLGWRLLAVWGS